MMDLSELNNADINKIPSKFDFESPLLAFSQDINCSLNTNVMEICKSLQEGRIN